MTMFDFEDGRGAVPAHQHPNGMGWVANTAQVADTAYVGPEARVYGEARVYEQALVSGYARVDGDALVCGDATVCGHAHVSGDARVYGQARVCGRARVSGQVRVSGDARVSGSARVSGEAHVTFRCTGDFETSPIVVQLSKWLAGEVAPGVFGIGCRDVEGVDYDEEELTQWGLRNGATEQDVALVRMLLPALGGEDKCNNLRQ